MSSISRACRSACGIGPGRSALSADPRATQMPVERLVHCRLVHSLAGTADRLSSARAVAQSGSASVWGTGGRGFKSRRPDRWMHQVSPRRHRTACSPFPNAISFFRIATIPVFWALIVDTTRRGWGIVLFGLVVATDWVDGTIARRTGQVTELGKILDPVADRARDRGRIDRARGAGRVSAVGGRAHPRARRVARAAAGALLLHRGVRIDVRWIGKVATFALMVAIPAISWGNARSVAGGAQPSRSDGSHTSVASSSTTWLQAPTCWTLVARSPERCRTHPPATFGLSCHFARRRPMVGAPDGRQMPGDRRESRPRGGTRGVPRRASVHEGT